MNSDDDAVDQPARSARLVDSQRGLLLAGKLIQLLSIFRDAGIPVMALKGPALSQLLYNDFAKRQFNDLDLLVSRADAPTGIKLLKANGYILDSAFAWCPDDILIRLNSELSFDGACGTPIDLHWEIAPKGFAFHFDPAILWSTARSVRIAGWEVPCPEPEALLLYLCVHGAKHMWSRLQWLSDVARLVEITPEMSWKQIFDLAARTGCTRVVLLGLLLAERLLGAPVPDVVQERIRNESTIHPLAKQVSQRLQQTSSTAPTSLELAIFNSKLAAGWPARIQPFTALLRAPTEADARLLRLPPALFFLYYPFRLGRLASKYALLAIQRSVMSLA